MEPWYKFILYGTYDGFSRSTLGDDNLYLVLENGEKVEIPRCFVKNASDFIEKDKLKLKDVIARIKKLDLGTQKVWLNEILNELGSDYGTLKYKAGYEQGKFEGSFIPYDEPQKPVVPQFVADWIEYCKNIFLSLARALNVSEEDFYNYANQKDRSRLIDFLESMVNQEKFARAWLDGYEVEKEKWYLVKMKNIDSDSAYLKHQLKNNHWYWGTLTECDAFSPYHTKKELEDAGLGRVFNSPLFEVEEVTE